MRPLIVCLLTLTVAAGGCDKASPAAEQANAEAPAAPVQSGPKAGEIDRSHKGDPAPTLTFNDPGGKPVTLASFKGKPVLLNLWATWCGPCVAEMPRLDALAGREAGKLIVIAASQEDDPARVAAFAAKARLKTLQPYLDPKLALSIAYEANLPTTILFDSQGHEVWRVAGALDWTSSATARQLAEAN